MAENLVIEKPAQAQADTEAASRPVGPLRSDASPEQQQAAPSPPPANAVASTARSRQVAERPMTGEILPPKRKRKSRLVLPAILLAVIGTGSYFGDKYLTEWRFLVSTDDAYVKADTSIIAAKVGGYIESVPVVEND